MHKVRTLIVSATLTALAATAIALPAAAAPGKGTIGLINGAPGTGRVDLCINGKEIRGRTKYGGRAYRVMTPGNKTIKVFKADPRKCKGKLLGKKTIALVAGDDFTIVWTRKSPKFTTFSNTLGDIPAAPGDPYAVDFMFWRHAADLGNASIKYQYAEPPSAVFPAIAPSVDPVWVKGDQFGPQQAGGPGYEWRLRATRPDKSYAFAKTPWIVTEASRRIEMILLGDKPKNAKFIVWIRTVVEK